MNILNKVLGRLIYYKHMWGLYTYRGIECNVKHGDTEFKILANSKIELYNRARDFESEKVTIDWIDNFIKDGDTVFDIGANIGIYTLLIAKKYSHSHVIAFEPEAGNFYKLNKNILLNRIKNAIPFPIGISNKTGITKLYVSSLELGSSCHSLDSAFSDGSSFLPQNEQGIACYTLDDLISVNIIPFPNHIKIDVDGFEQNILSGGERVFADKRLKSIVMEITSGHNSNDLQSMILSYGFKINNKEEWNYGNSDVSNILFKRND